MSRPIRTRFAPSPTGSLHLGGLRTALFNYLYAKKYNGQFILRIEDTDQKRKVNGADKKLIETLETMGLKFDEGPYYQSQRSYSDFVETLLQTNKGYRCFCSSSRLESIRTLNQKKGISNKYDRHCLHLTNSQIKDLLYQKVPFVVRLKVPMGSFTEFNDIVRGNVRFNNNFIDDQILMKSDLMPTYHLANVVDDHLMNISHVIRGEEWIASTPKHILLYSSFGWEPPSFAHLPLLLDENRKKLSKRSQKKNNTSIHDEVNQVDEEAEEEEQREGEIKGEQVNNKIKETKDILTVEEYLFEKNYLPESLLNFVAFLGWSPNSQSTNANRDIFTLDELVNEFDLAQVHKASAVTNINKLDWINSQHLRIKITENSNQILDKIKESLKSMVLDNNQNCKTIDETFLLRYIHLMKDRVTHISDLVDDSKCGYFFHEPNYGSRESMDYRKKVWTLESERILSELCKELNQLHKDDFIFDKLKSLLTSFSQHQSLTLGKLFHLLRYVLTGVSSGPPIIEFIETLGQEAILNRLSSENLSKVSKLSSKNK